MKNKKLISIILLAVSIILAVVAYILLPETVITQIGTENSSPTTMPKLAAVIIPTLLGAGGAAISLAGKGGDEKSKNGPIIVSAVGILVFVIMLFTNL